MAKKHASRSGRPNRGSGGPKGAPNSPSGSAFAGRGAKPSPGDNSALPETRTAEAATVAWMLTLMATLSAEGTGLLTRAWAANSGGSERLLVLSGTLLLVAMLSGVFLLVLTAVTLTVRRNKPPGPIVVLAIVSGCLPLVTTLLLVMR